MMTALAEDLEGGLNYIYTDKANIGTIESAYILETVTGINTKPIIFMPEAPIGCGYQWGGHFQGARRRRACRVCKYTVTLLIELSDRLNPIAC